MTFGEEQVIEAPSVLKKSKLVLQSWSRISGVALYVRHERGHSEGKTKIKCCIMAKKAGLPHQDLEVGPLVHPSAYTHVCAVHALRHIHALTLLLKPAPFHTVTAGEQTHCWCHKAGQLVCDQPASQNEHHTGDQVLPFPTLNGALTSKSMIP